MKRAHVILGLALLATAPVLPACGPSKPPVQLANITPGSLPSGESFKGVWYNPVWGQLHLIPSGNSVVGRWRSPENGIWGKMSGTINGDVIKFAWEEHKTGAIGPGSVRTGHGYFKFQLNEEQNGQPKLRGEWGYGENEVGGGDWDTQRLKDKEPNLDELKSDDDPTVDTGWDEPKK